MSERTPKNQDNPSEAPQNDAINPGRRKLAGAALGAGAVFTLASRPVWANQCSISGMASGNLSRTGPEATCEGCTPGYWMECQHLDSWGPTGFQPDHLFNTVFGVTQYVNPQNNKPFTLLEVMGLQGNSGTSNDKNPPNCSAKPNGNAVGNMGRDPVSPNLGFHAVAALLNCAHPNVNYGYTPGELIDLFRDNMHNGPALKDSLAMLNERGCPLN